MSSNKHKIIVVGNGISGSMAAINAAEGGAEVVILSLDVPFRSHSGCIREGINASFDTAGESDSVEEYVSETLACGDDLACETQVRRMCESAPMIVRLLERMGVIFERTQEGFIKTALSCGARKRRVVFAGPNTGHRVLTVLDGQLRRLSSFAKVKTFYGWMFMSPILDEGGACRGIVAINLKSMEVKSFAADSVILCTGGYQSIFGESTGSKYCDGSAAISCFKAGARFANPEFVQFHPFTIQGVGKNMPVVDTAFTEGVRPYIMRDEKPFHFLDEYHPGMGGGVTRCDAVKAVHRVEQEMRREDAHYDGKVYLDIARMDSAYVDRRLADILETYENWTGDDPSADPIRVVAAAHRSLGGLWIDDRHKTTIPGLFAAGGVACAYHGAGVLGGNEILSSIHGGMVAGCAATEYAKGLEDLTKDPPASLLDQAKTREEDVNVRIATHEGEENAHVIDRELRTVMSSAAGISRNNERLEEAKRKVANLKERFESAPLLDRSEWANKEILFMRRLGNKLELADIIIDAARTRDESRGSHFKHEFPERDDEKWKVTTKVSWTKDGAEFEYQNPDPLIS